MNFVADGILTNIDQRQGKNGLYTVVTFLTNQGKTIDVLYKGNDTVKLFQIPTMSKCNFNLEYTLGKFNQVVLHDVESVA